MAWSHDRQRGIFAATLASILALLIIFVVNDSFDPVDGLIEQEACTGSLCLVKNGAVWAKTIIGKVSQRSSTYVIPDVSAVEEAVQAADKASQLLGITAEKQSPRGQPAMPSDDISTVKMTKSRTSFFPFLRSAQDAETQSGISNSQANKQVEQPTPWTQSASIVENQAAMPQIQQSLSIPINSEMVEEPLPLEPAQSDAAGVPRTIANYPAAVRNAAYKVIRQKAVDNPKIVDSENDEKGTYQAPNIEYRIKRITVKFPQPLITPETPHFDQSNTFYGNKGLDSSNYAGYVNATVTEPVEIDGKDAERSTTMPVSEVSPSAENERKAAQDQQAEPIEEEPSESSEPTESEDEQVANSEKIPNIDWSYHDPETDPARWGALGYPTCSDGTKQSPINIESNVQAAKLPILAWGIPETSDAFQNGNAAVKAFYNGRSFEIVGLDALMTVDEVEYTLKQLHFHTPSEHKISGQHFDMEIHFVHSTVFDGTLRYLIVAVLCRKSDASERFIADIAAIIPSLTSQTLLDVDFASVAMSVLGQMEPVNPTVTNAQNYFRYDGSFTAPPCEELVSWIVLKNALPISDADLGAFVRVQGKNNRPVQALHDRVVLDSRLSE